jgi:hypothetical protein
MWGILANSLRGKQKTEFERDQFEIVEVLFHSHRGFGPGEKSENPQASEPFQRFQALRKLVEGKP